MLFKLSLRNVRRSVRDYTVYFLTLMLGVCLFYVFNSIESQNAMMKLNSSQERMLSILTSVIGYVSVFVAIVFGGLAVYANGFFIRRRKQEMGIYLTLGMPRRSVAVMLLLETACISIFSLAAGLLLGVFGSQGLSILTARLFEVSLSGYQFTFSIDAFIKTILCFGIIFFVVLCFNFVTANKLKLIDLINGGRKNQKSLMRKLWVCVVVFLVSVACLVFAYHCIIENGFMDLDGVFWMAIFFGSLGTLLFFFSLSGFLVEVLQHIKGIYFKKLNLFVLRQLGLRINTNFVSMSVICLMLLLTIGTLSCGIGMSNAITHNLRNLVPYDASINFYSYGGDDGEEKIRLPERAQRLVATEGFDDYVEDYAIAQRYGLEVYIDELLSKEAMDSLDKDWKELINYRMDAVCISDYNEMARLAGQPELDLESDQYAIICNIEDLQTLYKKEALSAVELAGKAYSFSGSITSHTMENMNSPQEGGLIVLPDEAVAELEEGNLSLCLQYKGDPEAAEQELFGPIYQSFREEEFEYGRGGMYYCTRQEAYADNTGLKVMVSYLSTYVGFVFLIAAAAMLSLQQLSESAENQSRFTILRQLGADERMLSSALLKQVAAYFFLPLALAAVHATVGISVANGVIALFGKLDILQTTIFTACIILLIYGVYFLTTYFASRNMLREQTKR